MKKILLSLTLFLINMGNVGASDVLTVENISVPQGGEHILEVACQFETECLAYQFDIELTGGLELLLGDDGNPICEKGFEGTDHVIQSKTLNSGKYRFLCKSDSNSPLQKNGVLISVTVCGSSTMSVGDVFVGKVTAIEFTTSNKEKLDPSPTDAQFQITIGEPLPVIILDENSTEAPLPHEAVDVTVRRKIKAHEWSTICFPFEMTGLQIKSSFGADVELYDFSSWSFEKVGNDVNNIRINFTDVNVDNGIKKNHPYLIRVSNEVSVFNLKSVNIDPAEFPSVDVDYKVKEGKKTVTYPGHMYGYYAKGLIDENELFISENKFWYTAGSTTIKAFRATFSMEDVLLNSFEDANSRIMMNFNDMTTGVDDMGCKINDSIGVIYDLQGRRVQDLAKGLYIRNGRKEVVK